MPTLTIPIECGADTCASEPGKFCRFVGSRSFGQRFVCRLFPTKTESFTPLAERDGWLQRCDQCKAAERPQEDVECL